MIALIILVVFGILTMFGSFSKIKGLAKTIAIMGLLSALCGAIFEFYFLYIKVEIPALSALRQELSPMLFFNNFTVGFSIVMIFTSLMIVLLSNRNQGTFYPWNEFYALILFSLVGAICMVGYVHLVMLFLGVEILSIPLYVLAASNKKSSSSNEAGLKYFLMGSFATGILLFGICLIYGAIGHFDVMSIQAFTMSTPMNAIPSIFWVGLIMTMIGLLFKISAAPFHFWSPDVYEGSPNIVTMYMSTVVKTAAFGAILLFLKGYFGAESTYYFWSPTIAIIATLTLFVANITAIFQQSFKRMLAYSSISQAGYLMIALMAPMIFYHTAAVTIFYLLSYAMASLVLFGGMILVCEDDNNYNFDSFRGLSKKQPFLALLMTIAMISLAGIPITAGFFSKYFVLTSVVRTHLWLVLVAIANSAISIYYYFKVVNAMYFQEQEEFRVQNISFPLAYKLVLTIAVLAIFALAIQPVKIIQIFLTV